MGTHSPASGKGYNAARLILRDMLVFDPHRLAWRLALRTVVGLMLPVLLAQYLAMPGLVWVGIGAFLLAIGDSVDDGDRWQTLRLTIGALLGGVALGCGILTGGTLALALIGTLAWGLFTGLMGVYGNTMATMALPVAWAYIELGLPSDDHSLARAVTLGGLFTLGGAVTLALAKLFRLGSVYAPLQACVATCFQALTTYLQTVASGSAGREEPITPETRMRLTLIEARRVATLARVHQQAASMVHQRLLVLIEIADRVFSLGAMHRELDRQRHDPADALTQPIEVCGRIGDVLGNRARPASLRGFLGPLLAVVQSDDTASVRQIDRHIARSLGRAVRLLLGEEAPPETPRAEPSRARLADMLAPLRDALDWNSLTARHALRFAVVATAAVAVFWVFPPPFGYWVPLTATVVLKPYAGGTLGRTVQRILGTVAGIIIGTALIPLLTAPVAQMIAVCVCFFCTMAVLPFNYGLTVLFLSAGIIPFEHLLNPELLTNVGLMRLVATLTGAALAVVGGHLLWPDYERDTLPDAYCATLRSLAQYIDLVLQSIEQPVPAEQVAALRRRAGLDLGNLQAAVQHALSEIGGDAQHMQAMIRAGIVLQRLLNTINAMMNVAPDVAVTHPDLREARARLATLLQGFVADRIPDAASIDALRPGRGHADPLREFLDRELDRFASQLAVLATIRQPSAAPDPDRQSDPLLSPARSTAG